jgi:hypothetical protein
MCGKTCRPTNRMQLSLPCVSIQVIDSPWSCDEERPWFNMESQHGQILTICNMDHDLCIDLSILFLQRSMPVFRGYSIEIQIAYDVYL